jgi:hypothetical protein
LSNRVDDMSDMMLMMMILIIEHDSTRWLLGHKSTKRRLKSCFRKQTTPIWEL